MQPSETFYPALLSSTVSYWLPLCPTFDHMIGSFPRLSRDFVQECEKSCGFLPASQRRNLAATACASHPEEQRHLVVLFSTVRLFPFGLSLHAEQYSCRLHATSLGRQNSTGFAVCLFASFRPKSHVILPPYLTDSSPRSVAHGMDHPSTRRDRPQLRSQLLRQRRTLGRDPALGRSRRSPDPPYLHSLNFGIQAYAD